MPTDSPLRWIRRRIFGVTQDQLAVIGRVSRPRVSRYETETDDPPFSFLKRVREEAIRRGHDFSGDWFFERPQSEDAAPAQDSAAGEASEP